MRECLTCQELFADELSFCPRDGGRLKAPDPWLGRDLEGGVSLQRVAGRGAMGTVYEGWQAGMERPVAVKILHADLSRDPEYLERFYREARAIARLNHPNIVSVFLLGEIEPLDETPSETPRPYIVMEYIEGDNVLDVIRRDGPLDPARVIKIMRQVVSALADAHATSVIHRDLKPANIVLSQRRRAADFVKMLDFGVAKITDATDSGLTQEGFVFGTPAYLSPEQANGVALDSRCDLYCLGVSMFEMLAGRLPFKGNQVQLLLAHAKEPAPRVDAVNPAVPAALADLVAALMEKAPADRPQTAEEVADILDHLAGSPAAVSPWASMALAEPPAPTPAPASARDRGPNPPRAARSGPKEVPHVMRPPTPTPAPTPAPASARDRGPNPPRAARSGPKEVPPVMRPPTPAPEDELLATAEIPRSRAAKRSSVPPLMPHEPDPPWVGSRIDGGGDEPWLSRSLLAMRQRVRGPGGWLLVSVLLIAGLAGGVLAGLGPLRGYMPVWSFELAAAPAPAPEPGAPDPPIGPADVPHEAVMVGQDGYSLRVLRPSDIVVGVRYQIRVDLWDPEGEPIAATQIPVELSGPGRGAVEIAARPGSSRGRFEVVATFSEAGDYTMRIFPPGLAAAVAVHFEVRDGA